ncbi:phosphoglucomutase/phosphomannomutase, C-terminal domain protein [Candidatus Endolissoclinum faulkneri L2]|uniref:Phosphoglucomutase/phosphomannomutase, C-terminal domain protein n=1 Tax=Candidatus Endolissoclinum faulkneri L2 TaxID=1193729 RepID=K7YFI0_9PROT|nr:phosphomannomutase/phosphoglucomutase [Candidatus Endolissoclinum faulkneri]AFX98340.1 phosphoglucomutase/phosphomannomutase, C-terminal domain protein [Candidatus Endolissoclinum faulkneri L2]
MHQFDPAILRKYDVRGLVGSELQMADAYALGKSFGTIVISRGGVRVVVGRDGRVSSSEIAHYTIKGLITAGIDVLDVGVCPSPALYFGVHHLGVDGGIMITASHNPSDYNGFKMMLGTAPFFGSDIQIMSQIARTGSYTSGFGKVKSVPVLDAYISRLLMDYRFGRELSVVWDCGNGTTGPVVTAMVDALPGTHTVLYSEIDGTFPNHYPDPTLPNTLGGLRSAVLSSKADLGIAFDGDGDRIGLIDESGQVICGDQLLAIYATEILTKNPGAAVIADVKASQVLFDHVTNLGGLPLMWCTGHSLIKNKMMKTGALLAGERSGHIFFKDCYYGFDDALYAALRILSLLSTSYRSLSDWNQDLPNMLSTPEIRFSCAKNQILPVIENVKSLLDGRDDISVNNIDGVRVSSKNGWWLLRASNTQDVLVARCEAQSLDTLELLKNEVVRVIRTVGLENIPVF